jgi:hypothetical protein
MYLDEAEQPVSIDRTAATTVVSSSFFMTGSCG